MRFIDRVRVQVLAGDGGDGAVAWRREAHEPRGGPAGGDGGRGGSVILRADDSVTTLLDLRYQQHYAASRGGHGGAKSKNGKGADDLVITVPAGTVVYFEGDAGPPGTAPPWVLRRRAEAALAAEEAGELEDEGGMEMIYVVDDDFDESRLQPTPLFDGEELIVDADGELSPGDLLGDLMEDGQELVVAKGGHGGRGNVHFKSSTKRTPDRAEDGTKGEARWIRLELKLLADVGIVGFPNVGKSTLIRKISRAKAEVGAYPFTTLVPQLGVVSLGPLRQIVVADIPGLVKGASEGKGLGHEFLRHLERTRVLLHLLAPDPGEGRHPLDDLDALEHELTAYGDMFEGRPRVVALNKIETPEAQALYKETKRELRKRNIPLFPISAHTGEGIDKLLKALERRIDMVDAQRAAEESDGTPG
jgi:GTP-binding protein